MARTNVNAVILHFLLSNVNTLIIWLPVATYMLIANLQNDTISRCLKIKTEPPPPKKKKKKKKKRTATTTTNKQTKPRKNKKTKQPTTNKQKSPKQNKHKTTNKKQQTPTPQQQQQQNRAEPLASDISAQSRANQNLHVCVLYLFSDVFFS